MVTDVASLTSCQVVHYTDTVAGSSTNQHALLGREDTEHMTRTTRAVEHREDTPPHGKYYIVSG